MEQYTIDFNGVTTYWYFYEAIIKGLRFPDWCGKNLDAIWDLVTGGMGIPAVIFIKGLHSLPKDLEREKKLLLETFDEAVDWFADINESLTIKIID